MDTRIFHYMFGYNKQHGEWELMSLHRVGEGEGNASFKDGKMNLKAEHITFGTKEEVMHEAERLNKELMKRDFYL